MYRLKGSSLLEAIVAVVLFLTVFAITLELLPRLTVRDDDALLRAEAEYRIGQVLGKYRSGLWPPGEYTEQYDWGNVTIRIEPYRDFADLQVISVSARIDSGKNRIVLKQLIERME